MLPWECKEGAKGLQRFMPNGRQAKFDSTASRLRVSARANVLRISFVFYTGGLSLAYHLEVGVPSSAQGACDYFESCQGLGSRCRKALTRKEVAA